MNVSALMKKVVAVVSPRATMDEAARIMREHGCGSVVVCEDDRPRAMLTDRDITLTALRTHRPLGEIKVVDGASDRLYSCRMEESIDEAVRKMALHQVRRLPVLGPDGRLAGILSLDDVAREAIFERSSLHPLVSLEEVGLALGQINRPQLIAGSAGPEA
ncbi:MAG: CBS domain-containing protein [Planctomycetota bacterium]